MTELSDEELALAQRFSKTLCLHPFDGVYCIHDRECAECVQGEPGHHEYTGSFSFDAVAVLEAAYKLRLERESR